MNDPVEAPPVAPAAPSAGSTGAGSIASAPGDVAMPEVQDRHAAKRRQFRHDNTISPLAPRPGDTVTVWASSGIELHLGRAALYYTVDGLLPNLDSSSIAMEIDRIEWDPYAGYLTLWRAELPALPDATTVRYRIGGWLMGREAEEAPHHWAQDGQGFWFKFPEEEGITTFACLVAPPRPPLPHWVSDSVVYHVFLDRFHPGTPDGSWPGDNGGTTRHGGTLAGVRQALPHIARLGATCIWLSPLHPSETYHRYDGMDFFRVDPALGGESELRALIGDAHDRGIRIWMDFVPAHSSWHHPAFLAAQRDRDADTFSWYTFTEWPTRYRSFLQVAKTLPSFNTDDPGARRYLIDSATYWIREFGVDGFRLDHAIAPSMDFWVAFRRATEAANSEFVNVGEATDTPDSLRRYRGKLHGVLDFDLARALRLTFGAGQWDLVMFDSFLESYERYMADGPGRVSFLDNHDMDRFLWVAGNDVNRLKLAALCQLTLAPVPVIYYGTEVGMTQRHGADLFFGGDAEARRDMSWDQRDWDLDLLAFYQSLVRRRLESEALKGGTRRTVHLDAASDTYAYLRALADEPAAGDALVLFNLGSAPARIFLPPGVEPGDVLLSTGDQPAVASRHAVVVGARTGVLMSIR
ncbi:MAG TPA: alpha-amylase family glycosyl hydrolase [Chloroflexota bacterium]|nr:alpha-amylase family glycosyl hydrolase [Chloroflexota bacterium]